MEYGMEDFWYGMKMELKKIASMEYGKIIFHSIPCPVYKSKQSQNLSKSSLIKNFYKKEQKINSFLIFLNFWAFVNILYS